MRQTSFKLVKVFLNKSHIKQGFMARNIQFFSGNTSLLYQMFIIISYLDFS